MAILRTRRSSPTPSETRRETAENAIGGASIFANAVSLMISRIAVAVMGWTGTLLIVRHLSYSNWGRYSFVFGLLGMMAIVTNAANPRVILRELGKDDGTVAGTYVLLRCALGLLAYVIALSFVSIGHYPVVVLRATAIAGLSIILANTSSGWDVLYQYRMRLSKVAMALALGQAAQLLLTIALALMGSSLVVFTVPAVLCEVVTFAWKFYRLPKKPKLHYAFLWGRWRELIKLSVPLALGGALATLYYNLDTVMLSKMQTFQAVGVYGISYKFAGIVSVFGTAMTPALFPIFVKYWPERPRAFEAVLRRTVRLYMAGGALITLEFAIFAREAISLLYGHHYAIGAGAARVVVASECVGFFTGLSVTVLVSLNRNIYYPLAALGGLVLNLGVNLWVIPRWSYAGAAWATLATESAVMIALWVAVRRGPGRGVVEGITVGKVLVCSGVAVGTCFGVWQVAPWPVAAAAGAIVYVAAVAALRVSPEGGIRSLTVLDEPASSVPAA